MMSCSARPRCHRQDTIRACAGGVLASESELVRLVQRHGDLLDHNTLWRRLNPSRVRHARMLATSVGEGCGKAIGRFTNAADVHDLNSTNSSMKWCVAHPADDEIPTVVTELGIYLLVRHVEGQCLVRVKRRSVNEHQLTPILEGNSLVGGEAPNPLEHQISQFTTNSLHTIEHQTLMVTTRVKGVWVEGGERLVGHSLDHDGARRGEAAPSFQRLWPRKHEIASDKELVKRTLLSRRKHSSESVQVSVDVRDAEEEHRGLKPYAGRRLRVDVRKSSYEAPPFRRAS